MQWRLCPLLELFVSTWMYIVSHECSRLWLQWIKLKYIVTCSYGFVVNVVKVSTIDIWKKDMFLLFTPIKVLHTILFFEKTYNHSKKKVIQSRAHVAWLYGPFLITSGIEFTLNFLDKLDVHLTLYVIFNATIVIS